MRLIDADALIEEIVTSAKGATEHFYNDDGEPDAMWEYDDLIKYLGTQPTIDAVEVVRCAECKWNTELENEPYPSTHFCEKLAYDIDSELDGLNWYCADGERREDDGMDSSK